MIPTDHARLAWPLVAAGLVVIFAAQLLIGPVAALVAGVLVIGAAVFLLGGRAGAVAFLAVGALTAAYALGDRHGSHGGNAQASGDEPALRESQSRVRSLESDAADSAVRLERATKRLAALGRDLATTRKRARQAEAIIARGRRAAQRKGGG